MSDGVKEIAQENKENRVALVFVSSTFRDMKKEREYLAETVFPRIKVYCRKRDVEFVPIDLRWGITKEQSNNGETLKRCLEEIDRSRPFFICLLGDRYGSTISSLKGELDNNFLTDYPNVHAYKKENIGVTEAEIRHGVLDLKEKDKKIVNAHFWFRTQSSRRSCDPRLTALKEKIRNETHKYSIDEYGKSKTGWGNKTDWLEKLGVNIENALKDWIDKTWPDNRELSWLEKQNLEQSAFEHSRRRLYVENTDDYKALDAFIADGKSRVFAVTGPSGLGKSSLLINWVKRYQDAHPAPEALVLAHYVSASEGSDQPANILRRFTETLDPTTRMDEKDENNPERLDQSKSLDDRRKEFAIAVNKWVVANPNSPLVIVIDGLNQLSEYDDAKILAWIPEHPKTKVVVSTVDTDRDTRAAIDRREWKTHNVRPLTKEQKRKIIEEALQNRGRNLSSERTQKIVDSSLTSNPLALCVLLDELCCFTDFKLRSDSEKTQLELAIERYLKSEEIGELLTKVLERIENSLVWVDGSHGLFNWFGRKKVVPILASLIAVSRYGLTANELQKISGCSPLAVSTFLSVFDAHLVDRSGRFSYSHDFIREAIKKRYSSKFRRSRELLIRSFQDDFRRRCQEVPWQLKELGKWKRLYRFLLNLEVFQELYDDEEWTSDFCVYWNALLCPENGGFKFDKYLDLDDSHFDDEQKMNLWLKLGQVTDNYNIPKIPELLYRKTLAFCSSLVDINPEVYNLYVAQSLNGLGGLHEKAGEFPEAVSKYSESISHYRSLMKQNPEVYRSGLSSALHNLGVLHSKKGDYLKAESELKESLELFRALVDQNPQFYLRVLGMMLGDLGVLHCSTKSSSKAESELKESLEICRVLKDQNPDIYSFDLARSLKLLGRFYEEIEFFKEAESKYKESLSLCRIFVKQNPCFFKVFLASVLLDIGRLHFRTDSYSVAETELKESLELIRVLADQNPEVHNLNLAIVLNSLGALHFRTGSYSEAESELKKSLALLRSLVEKNPKLCRSDLAGTLYNLGILHDKIGVYLEAESELKECLSILRTLAGEKNDACSSNLADTLFSLGFHHFKARLYEEAEAELKESLTLYSQLALEKPEVYKAEVANTSNILGNLYCEIDLCSEAEAEYQTSLSICRLLVDQFSGIYKPDLAGTLYNLGTLHRRTGSYSEAESELKESLAIRQTLMEEEPDVYRSAVVEILYSLAFLYYGTSCYELAKETFLQFIELFQKLPDAIQNSQTQQFEEVQTALVEIRGIEEKNNRVLPK